MSRDAKVLKMLLLKQLEGKTLLTTSTSNRVRQEFCTDGIVLGSSGQLLFAGGLSEAIQWSEQNLKVSNVSESEEDKLKIDLMFSNSDSSIDSFDVDI